MASSYNSYGHSYGSSRTHPQMDRDNRQWKDDYSANRSVKNSHVSFETIGLGNNYDNTIVNATISTETTSGGDFFNIFTTTGVIIIVVVITLLVLCIGIVYGKRRRMRCRNSKSFLNQNNSTNQKKGVELLTYTSPTVVYIVNDQQQTKITNVEAFGGGELSQ